MKVKNRAKSAAANNRRQRRNNYVRIVGALTVASATALKAQAGDIIVNGSGTNPVVVTDDQSFVGSGPTEATPGFEVTNTGHLIIESGAVVGNSTTSHSQDGFGQIGETLSPASFPAVVTLNAGGKIVGGIEAQFGTLEAGVGAGAPAIMTVELANDANNGYWFHGSSTAHFDNVIVTATNPSAFPGAAALFIDENATVTGSPRTVINGPDYGIHMQFGKLALDHSTVNATGVGLFALSLKSSVQAVGANIIGGRAGASITSGSPRLAGPIAVFAGGTLVGTGTSTKPLIAVGPISNPTLLLRTAGLAVGAANVTVSQGATLQGSGPLSAGLALRRDPNWGVQPQNVSVSDSTVQGDTYGVYAEGNLGSADLTMSNTRVKAGTDAGIMADSGSTLNLTFGGAGSSITSGAGQLLATRGNSQVDAVFNDHAALNGDLVNEAGSTMNVTLDQAMITGGATGVSNMTVLGDGAFVMTKDSNVDNLVMGNGSALPAGAAAPAVTIGSAATGFHNLTVNTLSGAGTFNMHEDFVSGTGDLLTVSGRADGNHTLNVAATGQQAKAQSVPVVIMQGTDRSQFQLVDGKPVDVGTTQYTLAKDDKSNNWILTCGASCPVDTGGGGIPPDNGGGGGTPPPLSNSAKTVLGLANTAPMIWNGENLTLVQRMGDLRLNPGHGGGVWGTGLARRYNVNPSNGANYAQQQSGLLVGADKAIPVASGALYVGGMTGYSNSHLNFHGSTSTGNVDAYSLGAYATWIGSNGWYVDGLAKLSNFANQANVQMSDGRRAKGNFNNWGGGLTAEVGRNFNLTPRAFVEPYTQLALFRGQAANYSLDNGMQVHENNGNSVQGELGVRLGETLELHQGRGNFVQPYLKLAVANEFVSGNSTDINNLNFDNDLHGPRGIIGGGVIAQLKNNLQLHVDVQAEKGPRVGEPWGVDVGLRYVW
jgi:outer membrane autotransporter protein